MVHLEQLYILQKNVNFLLFYKNKQNIDIVCCNFFVYLMITFNKKEIKRKCVGVDLSKQNKKSKNVKGKSYKCAVIIYTKICQLKAAVEKS